MLRELTGANFKAEVVDNAKGVVVVFTAPWCGACRMLKPELVKLANRGYKVGTVDVDTEGDLGMGVQALPTVLAFKGDEATAKLVGAAKEKDLLKLVEVGGVELQVA
ncbi:MAG: thioredoxin family protein [Minisyncoccia bacterium]